jgi:hypothetical protein
MILFVLHQGHTGPKGNLGDMGAKGDTGPKGDTGYKGYAGPLGPDGFPGPDGPTGAAGWTGPQVRSRWLVVQPPMSLKPLGFLMLTCSSIAPPAYVTRYTRYTGC